MKYTADCPNCFSYFSVNSEDIHLCHDGGFISKGYTFCPDCYITMVPLSAICKSYKSINKVENKH